jgi:glutamine amidotransferase
MFAYVGNSRDDLMRLLSALRLAARYDQLSLGTVVKQHRDGWGFVLCSEDGVELAYHRSPLPIFQEGEGDVSAVPHFDGKVFALFHARRASTGGPRGLLEFSHPFRGESEDGSLLYLAHNGALRRNSLPSGLTTPTDARPMVDSEIGLRYIIQRLRADRDLERATRSLEGFTRPRSALNLLILRVSGTHAPELFVKNFYRQDLSDRTDRTRYYQMCQQKMPGGRAVFSSTLTKSGPEFENAPPIETDELISLADIG